MSRAEEKLMLALETGFDGGSVAVLRNGELICSAEGAGNVSKSEDLLLLIDELLEKNSLPKTSIKYIAVSASPGSLTGVRIGLATAAGLGDALNAEVFKHTLFDAMLVAAQTRGAAIAAAYSEKGGIYYGKFHFADNVWIPETEILSEREPNVLTEILRSDNREIILERKSAARLLNDPEISASLNATQFHIIDKILAEIIGRAAAKDISNRNASDNVAGYDIG